MWVCVQIYTSCALWRLQVKPCDFSTGSASVVLKPADRLAAPRGQRGTALEAIVLLSGQFRSSSVYSECSRARRLLTANWSDIYDVVGQRKSSFHGVSWRVNVVVTELDPKWSSLSKTNIPVRSDTSPSNFYFAGQRSGAGVGSDRSCIREAMRKEWGRVWKFSETRSVSQTEFQQNTRRFSGF